MIDAAGVPRPVAVIGAVVNVNCGTPVPAAAVPKLALLPLNRKVPRWLPGPRLRLAKFRSIPSVVAPVPTLTTTTPRPPAVSVPAFCVNVPVPVPPLMRNVPLLTVTEAVLPMRAIELVRAPLSRVIVPPAWAVNELLLRAEPFAPEKVIVQG